MLAHFIVSDDVERSRRFYTEVLGGRLAFSGPGGLTYVALANTWIIINVGGGPTDDKPTVTLETPRDPDRVSSFLNIRVRDIHAVYAEWSARGAEFLTPPKQHQYEIRCYIRDPDGYLIEVGQTTDPDGRLDAAPLACRTGPPATSHDWRAMAFPSSGRPKRHRAALDYCSRAAASRSRSWLRRARSTSSRPSLSSRRSAAGGSGTDAR